MECKPTTQSNSKVFKNQLHVTYQDLLILYWSLLRSFPAKSSLYKGSREEVGKTCLQLWYGESKSYTYLFAFWRGILRFWLFQWSRQSLFCTPGYESTESDGYVPLLCTRFSELGGLTWNVFQGHSVNHWFWSLKSETKSTWKHVLLANAMGYQWDPEQFWLVKNSWRFRSPASRTQRGHRQQHPGLGPFPAGRVQQGWQPQPKPSTLNERKKGRKVGKKIRRKAVDLKERRRKRSWPAI